MKIIHAIYSFTVGGAETMLVDIINQQCKEASVSLIVVNEDFNINLLNTINKNVNIFLINRKESNKIQLISAFLMINKIVSKINPDVIHCHDTRLFPFFIRRKRITCLTVHGINLSVAFLKQYRQVFAISVAVQQNIKNRSGVNAQIVFNGIEINQYKSRINYKFEPKKDEFKIVQVSRLSAAKGQEAAIKAISLLKERNSNLNIKLYFVGGGDILTNLKEMSIKYSVKDQIIFAGTVDRQWIKSNLANFHLLIQPSLIEGFGLTVIEGFAAGLPVIASKLDGPEEICKLLDAGLLVRANDPADLAEKINSVYQSYISDSLNNNNYILKDKNKLSIFDIQTTAKTYINNYFFD